LDGVLAAFAPDLPWLRDPSKQLTLMYVPQRSCHTLGKVLKDILLTEKRGTKPRLLLSHFRRLNSQITLRLSLSTTRKEAEVEGWRHGLYPRTPENYTVSELYNIMSMFCVEIVKTKAEKICT
jgi:hypothetical protein